MAEDEPKAVRRGRVAMGQPVSDFADPARSWRLNVQCAGFCPVQSCLVAELVRAVPIGLT